jgi:hypothetical protein
MEYLIERGDDDWFDLPVEAFPEALHSNSFPWQRVAGWGDYRIRVLGCDISFSFEPPGIQIVFEGEDITGPQARRIVDEIARNVAAVTGQFAAVVEI